jgi:glutamate synthase domain-containing protein 2
VAPKEAAREPFRIEIGGPQCTQPYSASVFNISAMSYGSLSANAVRALNKGAKLGGFAHDTGEGGFTPYHRRRWPNGSPLPGWSIRATCARITSCATPRPTGLSHSPKSIGCWPLASSCPAPPTAVSGMPGPWP